MFIGVGYSDNHDSGAAGREAALAASKALEGGACGLILLFATARHDPRALREAAAAVLGPEAPIVGGGSIGAVCGDRFGYAGDQVILAAFRREGLEFELLVEEGLISGGEEETGLRLGRRLAASRLRPDAQALLFYDAIDRTRGDMRMAMATPLLQGLERAAGYLPPLVGAGLMSDYICSAGEQWTGDGVAGNTALLLRFAGDLRVDSAIMHGCRPATSYYTVTRAEGPVILEINGRPALRFMDELLEGQVPLEAYPFFLILGVNRGDKWRPFDENNYENRLCLAIDPERQGLVMFEPDMAAGTEFQVMYRSMDLAYIPPRIEELFSALGDRRPVFAMYINCAGRAAGNAGMDLEDAPAVQRAVAGRAPLLGLYTGVEIAPIEGRPRGLDWTGVFCLFSLPAVRPLRNGE